MPIATGQLNSMLDALVGRTTYTANAAFFAKLHIGDPGAAGTSNAAGETTRKQVTFGSPASSAAISNTVAIDWTAVSTGETYSHLSFWTASSAGTFLAAVALTASKTVSAGDNFSVAIGDLDLTAS